MNQRPYNKRSEGELKRLVNFAVGRVCGLPRPGLMFNIDEIESSGRPPSNIRVWATLHFTKEGSPYCCGEPGCHLGLTEDRLADIGEDVQRSMDLRQQVDVEFVSIGVKYHDDVSFHYGRNVFPCPACGFEVFDEPVGSYDICSICDWEDDEVQLRFPLMAGGANSQSLCEWQKRLLKQIPPDITEHNGFHRCPGWRPLTEEDCRAIEGTPTSGRQYFDAVGEEQVQYYWRS